MERRKFFSALLLGLPVATIAPAIKPPVDGPTITGYATCSCGFHMLAEFTDEHRRAVDYHCTNGRCPHFNVRYRAPHIPMEKV